MTHLREKIFYKVLVSVYMFIDYSKRSAGMKKNQSGTIVSLLMLIVSRNSITLGFPSRENLLNSSHECNQLI